MPELHFTYNSCRICGSQPRTNMDEMNIGPVRFWEPDDGWIIGSLCRSCHEEYGHAKPKPTDYAYQGSNRVCDVEDTDEDASLAL
jgi:hypothetical protein